VLIPIFLQFRRAEMSTNSIQLDVADQYSDRNSSKEDQIATGRYGKLQFKRIILHNI